MQAELLFEGLLPGYDAFLLFLLLGGPALFLLLLTQRIETIAEKAQRKDMNERNRFIVMYWSHERGWDLIHRLSIQLALFLMSLWFLFVFGLVSALVVYITLVLYGKGTKSLRETVKPNQLASHEKG